MAKPLIPKNELNSRVKKLQAKLSETHFDAVIVPLGIYFHYFFGKQEKPSERLVVGIIPQFDDPFLITPNFEMENFELNTYMDDICGWSETTSPYKLLAEELDGRGIGDNIGVDPHFWIIEIEKIKNATERSLRSWHKELSQLRSVKSNWEVTQLKHAASWSSQGIMNAFNLIEEGMTEITFQAIVHEEMRSLSKSSYAGVMVQFGENSAIPHGKPTLRTLKRDDVILVDGGTSCNGYQGDITITVPYGKPKGFEDIYEIVYQANRKALEAIAEGAIPAEIDNIARSYIDDNGFGINFTHRLGHGLGLEIHEDPYIVANNDNPLVAGNTHTLEPGIYQEGLYGIRIEDDILVQKDQAVLLYETPRYNFDIF